MVLVVMVSATLLPAELLLQVEETPSEVVSRNRGSPSVQHCISSLGEHVDDGDAGLA